MNKAQRPNSVQVDVYLRSICHVIHVQQIGGKMDLICISEILCGLMELGGYLPGKEVQQMEDGNHSIGL